MSKNFELLAPAGTYEAFIAAVENGADAIYLGGKLFNARANASNFDLNELDKIVKYAHLRNVKIYLTLNTILDDNELREALDFAYDLYRIGVDAVIVQDLGLASILHSYIPNLPLHASTQMTIYNLNGVKELEKLGFSRVVLARELSFDEINYICNNTNMEIEIFIHGALCVSYSGQCLMSSMIGDRSGNRGKCAQPCRLPYKLIENQKEVGNGYLLSPKDLSTIQALGKLPNNLSLKIEGRMKSPEYVATVVSTYKKYIDNLDEIVSDEDKNNLLQIFNRGGFSTAYLESKQGKDMMCYEKSKNWGTYLGKVLSYDGHRYIKIDNSSNLAIGDGIEVWNGSNESPSTIVSEIVDNKIGRISGDIHVGDKVYKTSSKLLMQKARESFSRGFVKQSPVSVKLKIAQNMPIEITINEIKYISSIIPQVAENQPITKDKIISQFCKTGNTPFNISSIDVDMSENLFLPVSSINEFRRQSLENYENYLLESMHREIEKKTLKKFDVIDNAPSSKELSLFIYSLKPVHTGIKNADNFYFSFKDALTHLELIDKFPGHKYVVLPTVTRNNYNKLIIKSIENIAKHVDGFVLSNLGQLAYLENISTTKIANYTFNIFNSYSIECLKGYGFDKVILSPELTKGQINSLDHVLPVEMIAYGNLCVMTSEYCPVGSLCGNFSKNNKCAMPCTNQNSYYLRDRIGLDFRVRPDNIDCQSNIFNCKTTSIETAGIRVDSIRIDIQDESIDEINNIINTHLKGQKLSGDKYTNGHTTRPV